MDENLSNLNIRFTADLTNLNAGIQQVSSLVKGMGDTVKTQTGNINSIGNATKGVKSIGNAIKDTTSKVSGLSKMFGSLVRINLAVWALRGAKALTSFVGNLTKMGSDITEIEKFDNHIQIKDWVIANPLYKKLKKSNQGALFYCF